LLGWVYSDDAERGEFNLHLGYEVVVFAHLYEVFARALLAAQAAGKGGNIPSSFNPICFKNNKYLISYQQHNAATNHQR